MKQEEKDKIKIVNFLIKLQEAIYAADEVSTIKGFNRNQTKMMLNRLMETINKEHGKAIQGLWDEKATEMHMVMTEVEKSSALLYQIPYYMIPELNIALQSFIDKNFKNEKS